MLTPADQIPWPEVTSISQVKIAGTDKPICIVRTPADWKYVAGSKADLLHIQQTAPQPA